MCDTCNNIWVGEPRGLIPIRRNQSREVENLLLNGWERKVKIPNIQTTVYYLRTGNEKRQGSDGLQNKETVALTPPSACSPREPSKKTWTTWSCCLYVFYEYCYHIPSYSLGSIFFINVYMVLFLFPNVIYIFLLLWLCILIVCLCMTILTEVFPCFFLSCKTNARVKPAKTGHGPHSLIFVLFYVLFVLCRSLYCLCVYVYCTTATGWLSNCS